MVIIQISSNVTELVDNIISASPCNDKVASIAYFDTEGEAGDDKADAE